MFALYYLQPLYDNVLEVERILYLRVIKDKLYIMVIKMAKYFLNNKIE